MQQPNRMFQVISGILALAIGILYLTNPTAGALEFLPDILPFVGNLDEAGATLLVVYGFNQLRGKPNNQLPPPKK